jgi:Fe-S cluster assembly protein SufD
LENSITEFSPAEQVTISAAQVKSAIFPSFEGEVLVFSNGYFIPELSSKTEGLSINLLSEKENTPLGSIADAAKDPFTALNQATFVDGIHISIAKKL